MASEQGGGGMTPTRGAVGTWGPVGTTSRLISPVCAREATNLDLVTTRHHVTTPDGGGETCRGARSISPGTATSLETPRALDASQPKAPRLARLPSSAATTTEPDAAPTSSASSAATTPSASLAATRRRYLAAPTSREAVIPSVGPRLKVGCSLCPAPAVATLRGVHFCTEHLWLALLAPLTPPTLPTCACPSAPSSTRQRVSSAPASPSTKGARS